MWWWWDNSRLYINPGWNNLVAAPVTSKWACGSCSQSPNNPTILISPAILPNLIYTRSGMVNLADKHGIWGMKPLVWPAVRWLHAHAWMLAACLTTEAWPKLPYLFIQNQDGLFGFCSVGTAQIWRFNPFPATSIPLQFVHVTLGWLLVTGGLVHWRLLIPRLVKKN